MPATPYGQLTYTDALFSVFPYLLLIFSLHCSLLTSSPPSLRSPIMTESTSQSPSRPFPTQPSEQASFFLTRPDNTTHKLNAPAPSLDQNSSSMLEQKRQLDELLKIFPYQAPTSLPRNTSISPLSLSKNPSSNGSVRRRRIRMHRFTLRLSTGKLFMVLWKLIYSLIKMRGNL